MPHSSPQCRVIGIAGPSAGAKTTFAGLVQAALGSVASIHVCHDDYYRDLAHLPVQKRARQNFDHPDALETELLIRHIRLLRQGCSVEKPLYDFALHTRAAETETVAPAPVILVEGILVLAIPALREQFDLRVYVDTPPDICLARRIMRDVQARGRTAESVVRQYLSTVRPMQEEWVLPSRRHAEIVVQEGAIQQEARRVAELARA